ncbi:uncharacterized protein LOC110863242 [Folsomia candida]|uniref:Uncharacterized protein n=1 Tax=Folsomia candida TaxID=158441 RepID=A0A226EXK1_FOLCA|nr:uncharacterized protein LOC110863242 [Folsomia candida]OXA62333.1 hypothetical protein Fcan01_01679 [Folsomia candida]
MLSKLTFQLFAIALFALFHRTSAVSFNEPCTPTAFCDLSVGLVCENALCRCAQGPLTSQVSYNLEWDSGRGECVGQKESACVGTRQSPVPTGMKAIHCVDPLTCIQLPDMPLGVGSCINVPKVSLNGTSCTKDAFCDSSRSLVCTDGLCTCATSRRNTSPDYKLVWDVDNCVATIGAPCIGTNESPVAAGHKRIECIQDSECVQVSGQTPGVGTCVSTTTQNTATMMYSGIQIWTIMTMIAIVMYHN